MIHAPSENNLHCSDLKSALKQAGLLLNTWFHALRPVEAKTAFLKSQHIQDEYSKKLSDLQIEMMNTLNEYHTKDIYELALSQGLDELSISSNQTDAKLNTKWQVLEKKFSALKSAQLVNAIKDDNHYSTFLFPLDSDSKVLLSSPPDDYVLSQKNLLKIIKKMLMEIKHADEEDVAAFLCFIRNLEFIVSILVDSEVLTDTRFVANWLKLGFAFLRAADNLMASETQLNATQRKMISDLKELISLSLFTCYLVFARLEASKAKSEMELMYAESCLESACKFYEQIKEEELPNAEFYREQMNSLNAGLAFKSKDMDKFRYHIDKITLKDSSSIITCEVLIMAGDYFREKDASKALYYYELALAVLEKYFTKQLLELESFAYANEIKRATLQKCDDIKLQICNDIKKRIQTELPNIRVNTKKVKGALVMFLPLEEIPRDARNIIKGISCLDINIFNDNKFVGLQMVTKNLDEEVIIKAVSRLKDKFSKSKQPEPRLKVTVPPKEASSDSKKSESKGIIESPPEPYVRPTEVIKEKTRKELPVPTPTVAPAITPRECHASDFGFKIEGNPLVTPVYCTKAAQTARCAKLFVRWVGIPGVDALVESQFEGMLNPKPEGILTVGMYDQQGAKLWKDPDNLREAWNLCALRFKRKGASGFIRAQAIPECQITVEHNGRQENRYMFRLGTYKHK